MERAELAARLAPWRRQPASTAPAGARLVAQADPREYLAAIVDAVAGDADVFLCDPHWSAAERAQLDVLLSAQDERPAANAGRGWLMIPTGGSSGQLRFARHDQDTVAAAVEGFRRHFGVDHVNAVGLLPLHHVSGLMGWLRCALSGGEFLSADWKAVQVGAFPEIPVRADGWQISLVPTQLERLLAAPAAVEWLRGFRAILIGGGPAWSDLLDRAAAAQLPLAPSYGMTETAAMVTALRPTEFLADERSSGTVLPHAYLTLSPEGTIGLAGPSVCRGYFPAWNDTGAIVTNDTGALDARGRLTVWGRNDQVIITGGEKVDPAEVEAALHATGEFHEVVVLGLPDPEWGQLVVAVHPATERPDIEKVQAKIGLLLSAAKRPKHFLALVDWPASAAWKLNRATLRALAQAALGRQTGLERRS